MCTILLQTTTLYQTLCNKCSISTKTHLYEDCQAENLTASCPHPQWLSPHSLQMQHLLRDSEESFPVKCALGSWLNCIPDRFQQQDPSLSCYALHSTKCGNKIQKTSPHYVLYVCKNGQHYLIDFFFSAFTQILWIYKPSSFDMFIFFRGGWLFRKGKHF